MAGLDNLGSLVVISLLRTGESQLGKVVVDRLVGSYQLAILAGLEEVNRTWVSGSLVQ